MPVLCRVNDHNIDYLRYLVNNVPNYPCMLTVYVHGKFIKITE